MTQKIKQLPQGWQEVKLGEVCEIVSGSTPSTHKSEYWNGEINWVTPAEISDEHNWYYGNTVKKITKKGIESSSVTLFPKGTVMLTSRAPIGKVAIADREMCSNQGFKNFICNTKQLNPEYLYFWFRLKKEYLNSIGHGATFKEISKGIVANLKIPLPFKDGHPDLNAQRRIVSILEKAEKLKQRCAEADELTKDYLQSVFGEMFLSNKDKKNWQELPLSEVVELNPKKSELGKVEENTKVTFLRMEDIGERGEIFNKTKKEISEVIKGYTYFNKNDILFAKITPCMENGKGAIAIIDTKIGFGSTEFHVLRPIKDKSTSEWIYYLLSLKPIREQAKKNMTGSAGQKRVPASFFDILMVHLPPLPLQQKFAKIVERVEKLKEAQEKSREKIDELFNSLMQRAFNGELVI
jgi:type I restriction enzyme S subunit